MRELRQFFLHEEWFEVFSSDVDVLQSVNDSLKGSMFVVRGCCAMHGLDSTNIVYSLGIISLQHGRNRLNGRTSA